MNKQLQLIGGVAAAMTLYWVLMATVLDFVPRDIVIAACATLVTVLLIRR